MTVVEVKTALLTVKPGTMSVMQLECQDADVRLSWRDIQDRYKNQPVPCTRATDILRSNRFKLDHEFGRIEAEDPLIIFFVRD